MHVESHIGKAPSKHLLYHEMILYASNRMSHDNIVKLANMHTPVTTQLNSVC